MQPASQDWLGHSNIATTMSTYAHLIDFDQDEVGPLLDHVVTRVRCGSATERSATTRSARRTP